MKEKEVRLTYKFLGHKYCTEVRVINPFKQGDAQSIFVYSEDEFVNACRRFEGTHNIYVGINERINGGTNSDDVITVNMIVFDIDPVRPRGLPATENECKLAEAVTNDMVKYLNNHKKYPYVAFSGNGYQIWLKMDIEIRNQYHGKQVELVLKDMQRVMAKQFTTDSVRVDNIGDLARVIKVIGTKSLKPMESSDRPNRYSKWVKPPINLTPHVHWGMSILSLATGRNPNPSTGDFTYQEKIVNRNIVRFISNLTPRQKQLYRGDYSKYKSRSEAEFAFILSMRVSGLTEEESWSVMEYSGMSKWKNAGRQYKEFTMRKVYGLTL